MFDPAYRRRFIRLTALCTFAYFVSYLSRINLEAVMVEIVSTGFTGKETAALALSVNAIAYGAGQIISGWLGDRCRPQNVMLCGFVLAGAVNLGVGLCPGGGVLIPLWAVNGFAQALMWPPLVKLMAQNMMAKPRTVISFVARTSFSPV